MKSRSSTSSTSGSTLLMVLIMLFIISGLCTVSLTNGLSLQRIAESQVAMEEAYLAAESGIQVAAARLNSGAASSGNYTQVNGNVVSITVNGSGTEYSVSTSSTVSDATHTLTVPRMFRPSHFSYGIFVEDFDGTWLPGDEVDGRVWTGTSQTIVGFNDAFGGKKGPVFASKNQTGANSFSGTPDFASTLDPDVDILSYLEADKRYWNTYTRGFDINVTMPALSSVNFSSVKTGAITNKVNASVTPGAAPLLIDPDQTDLTTALTNQILYIEVPSPPPPHPVPPADYSANGRDFPSSERSRVELRFNTESNYIGEDSGVLHISYGTAADFSGGTETSFKVYSTSLDLIYIAKDYTPPTLRDKWDDFEVVIIPNTANITDGRTNILRGNLTIWSEDQVTIQAGIEYDNVLSDTFGVVCGDDIEIQYTVAGTIDGTPDMQLHGGYLAADVYSTLSRFQFMNYDSGVVRGELRLFGSLAVERLYPFGEYTLSAFTSGFLFQMEHDDRLITSPPPYSPVLSNKFYIERYY